MELKEIRRISFENGIGINYISKENKITELLTKLYLIFKDKIILKGGTALNRGYLNDKGRFSEDIDLDFINKYLKQSIEFLKEKMNLIDNFTIEKARLMNKTLRFDCFYINELNNKDRIQVEFYLGHNKIIGNAETIAIKSPILHGQTNIINTYNIESLIARKIVALLNREEGKDLYDLFYSLKEKFNKEKVKKQVIELCKYYDIDYKLINRLLNEKFESIFKNIKYIGNSTNHFITKENSLGWKIIAQETKKDLINVFK
jgi:uncharacterized protein